MRIRSTSKSVVLAFALASFALAIPAKAQRLPQTIKPEHYSLTLPPDLKGPPFAGSASNDIALTEPSSSIAVNAAELEFQSVSLTAGGAKQTASVSLDA